MIRSIRRKFNKHANTRGGPEELLPQRHVPRPKPTHTSAARNASWRQKAKTKSRKRALTTGFVCKQTRDSRFAEWGSTQNYPIFTRGALFGQVQVPCLSQSPGLSFSRSLFPQQKGDEGGTHSKICVPFQGLAYPRWCRPGLLNASRPANISLSPNSVSAALASRASLSAATLSVQKVPHLHNM